jgi:flagellar motor switch protein FliG
MPVTSTLAELSGPRKAAVLLVLLGEDTAGKLLRHLSREQMGRVVRELASLGPIERDVANGVLEEYFVDAVRPEKDRGGPGIARRILTRADVPEDQVNSLLGRPESSSSHILGPLLETRPATLARAMADEHPQTTALILLNLPPARAARALAALPETTRSATVLRMATMRRVRGELLGEVADSIRERLSVAGPEESTDAADGIERTAEVLASLGRPATRQLLEEIESQDPERAAELRSRIFTFDTLLEADDRGIQELLRQVETKVVALSLHGEEEEIVQKIIKNLSERAAGILKDEIEFLSSVRPEEKAAAQNELVAAALKLEEEGRLSFVEAEDKAGEETDADA